MKHSVVRTSPWASPDLRLGVTAAVSIGGLFMLAFGIWALFAPASFADFVAFPYNRHLLHDVGAFRIGIGTTMLIALLWADSVMVVLAGYVVGTSFHLTSHIIDRHIGGHGYDPLVLSLLVVIGPAGIVRSGTATGQAVVSVLAPGARERDARHTDTELVSLSPTGTLRSQPRSQ